MQESEPEKTLQHKNSRLSYHNRMLKQGALDNTTMVNYSIKFYYTPEFAKVTPDIPGFIAQIIAETNQGYAIVRSL
jgi:hypothetical protein